MENGINTRPMGADAVQSGVRAGVAAAQAGAIASRLKGSKGFGAVLGQVRGEIAAREVPSKQVREAAAGLVSNALILPLFKQLRRSSLGHDPYFGGGIAENTFGPQFDMQLADRIAQSPNLAATNVLAERLMNSPGYRTRVANEHKGLDLHG